MRHLLLLIMAFAFTSLHAQTKEDYYKKAEEFKEKKDLANAIKQIDQAILLDPGNTEYLLFKGNALYESKQFQPAFDTYTKIIELHPTYVLALNQRGLLLNTVQEFEYAIRDFDKALSISGADSFKLSLYVNRGAAKTSIRDFQGAYDDYMEAYKIDSLEIGTLNNLATVCDEVGKGDQTLKYLYKILAIDSTFIGAYGNIGFKYQEMGDHKKAIRFFDKVISLDANEPLAYSNRSFNRYKLGDYKGALSDVEKSIALYPGNSYAFRNRALIYIAQKKMKEACADLQTASELGFTKMYGDEVDKLRLKHCALKRN